MNKHDLQTGFTLLELMAAVAVAGILLAVAVPSYQNMVKNNCMITKTNTLVGSFQLARSEAVKRRTDIRITASNSADDTNEWGTGWTVWQDADNNNTLDNGEEIRVVQLACVPTTVENDTTEFIYRSTGFINTAGSFTICDDRIEETGRVIDISLTGRPNTETDSDICD